MPKLGSSFIFLNYDSKRKLVKIYELERAQKWIHSHSQWLNEGIYVMFSLLSVL